MKNYLATFVGTAAVVVLSNVSWASDPTDVPDHSLSEWKLGEIISGPEELDLVDLDGKVVAIELWGIN